MSQLSKVKHSRAQWKHKATQRGDRERYQRKQIACITAERDRATQALKAAQARLRQLERQCQELVARPKVDVVFLALQLFFVARIGFRAVSRVLSLLAWALGIKKAPCPQTIINWVMRLAIVRIESARMLKGLPLRQAPFTNGLIWMLDISIGLGTGKMVAVLACVMPITINSLPVPSPWSRSTVSGSAWRMPGRATRLPRCSAALSLSWDARPPTSKTGAATSKRPLPYWVIKD